MNSVVRLPQIFGENKTPEEFVPMNGKDIVW